MNIPFIDQIVAVHSHVVNASVIGSYAYGYNDKHSDFDIMLTFDDIPYPVEICAKLNWNNCIVSINSISISAIESLLKMANVDQIPFRSYYAECICLTMIFSDKFIYTTPKWSTRVESYKSEFHILLEGMKTKCSKFAHRNLITCSHRDIYYHIIMLNILRTYYETGNIVIQRSIDENIVDVKRQRVSKRHAFEQYKELASEVI